MNLKLKDPKKLVLSFLVVFAIAGVASFLTATDTVWYENINKPSFIPPSWLFGLMWPILYTLMALSLYLVWTSDKKKDKGMAFTSFFVQLVLNIGWALLFFRLNLPTISLIEVVFLETAIAYNIYEFNKHSRTAALLLVPYLLWIALAIALNFAIVVLN